MFSPSGKLKEELIKMIKWSLLGAYPSVKLDDKTIRLTISYSKKAELGDISVSIAFRLSKMVHAPPEEIAKRIVEYMKLYKMLSSEIFSGAKVEKGYINMSISQKEYARWVIESVSERAEIYGASDLGKGRRVIVESPSVNPNKPWHIGHLRNALLGDAVSNIMTACAYNVEREDYIDDLGVQVAESLWGYMNLGNKPDKKMDQWLGEQYVLVNQRMEKEKPIADEIKALNQRMEDPKSKEAAEARKLAQDCVKAQYETNADYGISHDLMVWESDVVAGKLLEKALKIAQEKGVLEKPTTGKYAGCVTLPLEKAKELAKEFENPAEDTKVLVRSNGTSTYVAKDIAFHMWKLGIIEDPFEYEVFIEKQPNGKKLYSTAKKGISAVFSNADRVINIIGVKQRYEQIILRSSFKLMGYAEKSDNIIHLAYGEVSLEEGSISGRKGTWLGSGRNYTADNLLSEAIAKAKDRVEQSKKITDKTRTDEISKAIALGAIKFEYLKISPEKNVTFSWEKAMNFEGNSGPYCMYTYARANRILANAFYEKKPLSEKDYLQISRGMDFELVKKLGMAQEMVEKACEEYRPDLITEYLLDVSGIFSSFYEKFPVMKGEEAREIRLALVSGTMQVLKNMLLLIGIKTIDQM
jgi:arginyl-tRNA synthetase